MRSPFRPGFGKPPTVLAGRSELADELYEAVTEDAPDHRAVVGPRGVGKTVLLREVERRLHNAGDAVVVWQSCDSKQATSEVLARTIIETTRRLAPWWESFGRALSERLSVGFDAVAQITLQPRPGEDFHPDSILTTTIDSLGQAARDAQTQVVVFVDEVQSLQGTHELVRVSQALDLANGRAYPVSCVAAGLFLPEGPSGAGGSFLERIDHVDLGNLTREATEYAVTGPLALGGVGINLDALEYLVNKSQGYPYFVQLYGNAAWKQWRRSADSGQPITKQIALDGVLTAQRDVDRLFQRRFDRLGPSQQQFLVVAGNASTASGVFTIGETARTLGVATTDLSTTRASLIDRHQLIEPTGKRGELKFVLPEYHSWAATRGAARLELADSDELELELGTLPSQNPEPPDATIAELFGPTDSNTDFELGL